MVRFVKINQYEYSQAYASITRFNSYLWIKKEAQYKNRTYTTTPKVESHDVCIDDTFLGSYSAFLDTVNQNIDASKQ